MARIPQKDISLFTLSSVPGIVDSIPADTRPIEHLGRILMDYGLKQGAEEARERGIREQSKIEDGSHIVKDSSFFGFFNKEFDEGAKYMYQKQKQIQIDDAMRKTALENPYDPENFDVVMSEKKVEIFEGVRPDVMPGVKFYYDKQLKDNSYALREDAVKREIKWQQDAFLLDIESVQEALQLDIEYNGEEGANVELFARYEALLQRGEEMGIGPEVIEGLRKQGDMAVAVSEMVYEYRNKSTIQEKQAFLNELLDPKPSGPLKEFTYLERLQIASKLSNIDNADSTAIRSQIGLVKNMLREDIAILGEGYRISNPATKLAQAKQVQAFKPGDAELADLINRYSQHIIVQQTTEQLLGATNVQLDDTINKLENIEANQGFQTRAEAQLLTDARKIRFDHMNNNATGNWLDYYYKKGVKPHIKDWDTMPRSEQVHALREHHAVLEEDKENPGTYKAASLANVNYFYEDEIKNFKSRWESGQLEQMQGVVDEISQNQDLRGVDLDMALHQIAGSSPELAVMVNLAGNSNTRVFALNALNGMQFLKDTKSDAFEKQSESREKFGSRFTKLGMGVKTRTAYTSIAMNLIADKVSKSGKSKTTVATRDEIDEITNVLIGGEPWMMPSGQEAVPLQKGLTRAQNKAKWQMLKDDHLIDMSSDGQLPVDTITQGLGNNTVNAQRIKEESRLIPAGGGKFYIFMPVAPGSVRGDWSPIVNRDGKRFVLDPTKIKASSSGLPQVMTTLPSGETVYIGQ